MKKTIITVVGKDKVGILYQICRFLNENNINILDVSQTIVDGFFNMMMIVDISKAEKEFQTLEEEFAKTTSDIGLKALMQKEEIFDFMHRI